MSRKLANVKGLSDNKVEKIKAAAKLQMVSICSSSPDSKNLTISSHKHLDSSLALSLPTGVSAVSVSPLEVNSSMPFSEGILLLHPSDW